MINVNPVALIRQKSKFLRKDAKQQMIRRLSTLEWQLVINIAKKCVQKNKIHERDLFILSCLYGMYLRISELVQTTKWQPKMGDFFRDYQNNWWFRTVGKGNKLRQIAVSDSMLQALKRYRENYLQLPPYPSLNETTPLISFLSNYNKSITSTYPIRKIVQIYFDLASEKLHQEGKIEESINLQTATVHWLRHTGISDDIKHRPREHVRDDAGQITDRYIDVEFAERASSAKHKSIYNNNITDENEKF